MNTRGASRSSWRIVLAVVLLAFGATALHRADRDPVENYTQAVLADVIALALIVSHFRRKRRAEQVETSHRPLRREGTVTVAGPLDQQDEQPVAKSPPAAPSATFAPAGGSSLENELRSLAALKADGIISEEEFTAKKRALLGL
jgi:putative oligomerization/nucleic acid binding protein